LKRTGQPKKLGVQSVALLLLDPRDNSAPFASL
jgi:hypothetical protein